MYGQHIPVIVHGNSEFRGTFLAKPEIFFQLEVILSNCLIEQKKLATPEIFEWGVAERIDALGYHATDYVQLVRRESTVRMSRDAAPVTMNVWLPDRLFLKWF